MFRFGFRCRIASYSLVWACACRSLASNGTACPSWRGDMLARIALGSLTRSSGRAGLSGKTSYTNYPVQIGSASLLNAAPCSESKYATIAAERLKMSLSLQSCHHLKPSLRYHETLGSCPGVSDVLRACFANTFSNVSIKDSISLGRALRYWWRLVTRSSVKAHSSSDGGILPLLGSGFPAPLDSLWRPDFCADLVPMF